MRHLKFTFLFAAFFGLFAIVGCCDDDSIAKDACTLDSDLACIQYEQTSCDDPWGNDAVDAILVEKLKNYFTDLEVELLQVEFENKGPRLICRACFCKTGNLFHAQVHRDKLDIVIEQGFTEK